MGLFDGLFGKKKKAGSLSAELTVEQVFTHLFKHRSPITIVFEDHTAQFSTIMLDFDKKRGVYILDELTPKMGNKFMHQNLKFEGTSSDAGIAVKFKGRMLKADVENDIEMYYIRIPKKIDYQQRRDAFRVPVPERAEVALMLRAPVSEIIYTGRVIDISMTGLKLQFQENITQEFAQVEAIDACKLVIGELREEMRVDIEVRHVHFDEERNLTFMGVAFEGLNPAQQNKVNQFITGLQRELRRKEVRSEHNQPTNDNRDDD